MGTTYGTQRDNGFEYGHDNDNLEGDKLNTDSDTQVLIIKPENQDIVLSKPPEMSVINVTANTSHTTIVGGNASEQQRVSVDMSDNSDFSDTEFESATESADETSTVSGAEGISQRNSLNRMALRIKNKIKDKITKYKDGSPTDIESGSPDIQHGDAIDSGTIATANFQYPMSQNNQYPQSISALTPEDSQQDLIYMTKTQATVKEEPIERISTTVGNTNPQMKQMDDISSTTSQVTTKHKPNCPLSTSGKEKEDSTANVQCRCKPANPKHARRKTVMLEPTKFGSGLPSVTPVNVALKSVGIKPGAFGVAPATVSKAIKEAETNPGSRDLLDAGRDLVKELKDRFKRFKDGKVYTVTKSVDDLKLLQRGMFSDDDEQTEKFADELAKSNFVDVFRDVLTDFSKEGHIPDWTTTPSEQMKYALLTMWSGTDASSKLCAEVVKDGVYKDMLQYLDQPKLEPETIDDSSSVFQVALGFLGVLCNCIRRCDADDEYRDAGALEVANKYRNAKSRKLQCKAEILLAYIMTEDENDKLNTDAENIKFIGHVFDAALKEQDHFSAKYGYTAEEILDALNRLAASDQNKTRIIKANLLKNYVKLLDINNSSESEQVLSAQGLWLLSFKEKEAVLAEPGCVEGLILLREHGGSPKVRDAAGGALWLLDRKGEKKDSTTPSKTITEKSGDKKEQTSGHVMISYQWDVQPVMLKVRDRLEAEGYDVWMDVDDMSGSILEAMANAVEDASIIAICLSEKYKKSPNCRTEAEYAYRCQKNIIPLMLQRRYRADGWLGAIAGNKLYFDFSQEEKFQASMDGFLVELARFFGTEKEEPMKEKAATPSSATNAKAAESSSRAVSAWSDADVKKWLDENELSKYAPKFAGMNGYLLLELKTMYDRAPESFYTNVRDQLKLTFLDSLKLTKALKTLH